MTELSDPAQALVVLLFVLALFGLGWLARKRTAPVKGGLVLIEDRLGALERRQEATEHHVGNIRQMLNSLPTKDAVHRIDVEVTALSGKIERIDAQQTTIGKTTDRILDVLLDRKS